MQVCDYTQLHVFTCSCCAFEEDSLKPARLTNTDTDSLLEKGVACILHCAKHLFVIVCAMLVFKDLQNIFKMLNKTMENLMVVHFLDLAKFLIVNVCYVPIKLHRLYYILSIVHH